jgi:hypothetical protein
MRAELTWAAWIGAGTLWCVAPAVPAAAQSSDDLVNTPGGISSGGADTERGYVNNLDIVDDALKPKLDLVRIDAQRGSNGLLGVVLNLSNKTGRKLDLEVETVYKDKSGNELNTGSWIPFTVQPHGELEYHSAAISEAAVDFLIRIRRARSH